MDNGHTSFLDNNFFKAEKTNRFLIPTHEPGVLRAWAKQLGVSEGRVRKAVEKVGPSVAGVIKYLKK